MFKRLQFLIGLLIIILSAGAPQTSFSQEKDQSQSEKEREQRQNVGEIFDMLGIMPGSRVADIGAGSGFFTVRIADAVGAAGRVYAVDIDEKVLTKLRKRIDDEGLRNTEVILGDPDNAKLPAELDAVLIVNSYHEMPHHQAILDQILRALKPKSHLFVSEPFSPKRRGTPRESQEKEHEIAPELVEEDLRKAGFEIIARNDEFIKQPEGKSYEWFILARKN